MRADLAEPEYGLAIMIWTARANAFRRFTNQST